MGGAERQAALLSESLSRRGLAVEVLTLRFGGSVVDGRDAAGGIEVHRVPHFSPGKRMPARGLWTWMVTGPRLRRAIRRLAPRFDIFHAHNASAPMTAVAAHLARRAGLRVVVKAASSGELFDLTQLARYGVRGRLARRWLDSDVDRWIAISDSVRNDLLSAGVPAERVASIPNGVLVPRAPRALPELGVRFLHLGRLDKKVPRDIGGLMAAFERAHRANPEVEIAIVGGGDDVDEVRRRAAASPASHRIQVPGFQEGGAWYEWAHVYVQPSRIEGLSNSLLEAMASGLACIAYDIPPNRQALDDGRAGILVPVGDTETLAASMIRLAEQPGLARDLGRRARERAATTYQIETVAERTEALYRELLSQPRPRPRL